MIGKSTEYAIRALVYIQMQNWIKKRPGVTEIATEIEAPIAYIAKILQILTKRKIIDSVRGRGGGFFFSEDNKEIELYEVTYVLEGDHCFHKCGFGLKNCNDENPCPLHEKYAAIRDGYFGIFKTETIQSLAKKIISGDAYLKSNILNN